MNERIRELAVKAKLMAEEDINRQISYNTELKAFAEKFAELIVKECSYLADQAHHKATGGKSAGGYIRQHFGVEE